MSRSRPVDSRLPFRQKTCDDAAARLAPNWLRPYRKDPPCQMLGVTDALGIASLLAVLLHWANISAGHGKDAMDFIVPRGGKPQRYKVQLLEHLIFLDLANSKQSSEFHDGVRKFVNKWGLPGH
jgi:hypothetical protein